MGHAGRQQQATGTGGAGAVGLSWRPAVARGSWLPLAPPGAPSSVFLRRLAVVVLGEQLHQVWGLL